jgi:hypothetical protein
MTDRFEKLAKELEAEADERENHCIRYYGGIEDCSASSIRATRRVASALRALAFECYLSGINLKVTRV